MFNGAYGFEEPKTKEERETFKKKFRQHKNDLNNPCIAENDMVFKCLDNNNYKHEKCVAFFENYKFCKKFWGQIRAERRKLGILPHLPAPEEREKIKADYIKRKSEGS